MLLCYFLLFVQILCIVRNKCYFMNYYCLIMMRLSMLIEKCKKIYKHWSKIKYQKKYAKGFF